MDNITKDNEMFTAIAEELAKKGIKTTYITNVIKTHITGLSYMEDFDDTDGEEILLRYDDEYVQFDVYVLLRDNGKPCFTSCSKADAVKEFVRQIHQLKGEEIMDDQRIKVGDIVQHFKRELCDKSTKEYLYQVLAFAQHTETGEQMVVYKALYPPFTTYVRPYDMFMGEVDKKKYPNIKQKYRLEVVTDHTDKTDHCTSCENGGQV